MLGWFQNLKMQTKLLTLFSLITLLGAVITAWYVYMILEMQRDMERLVKEANEIADVEEVQVYLLQEQIAISGYRLTGSEKYITAYERNKTLAEQNLRRAFIDAQTSEQRDKLNLLDQEIEQYNQAFDDVVKIHDTGDIENAIEATNEIADEEEARVQRMHEQVERFVFEAKLDLEEQLHLSDQRTKTAVTVGVIGMLLFSLLAVVASIVTNQVAEPIAHLTNAVVAFENNTYEPTLLDSYIKRREEVGKLARAFNNMVFSITSTSRTKDQLLNAASRFIPSAYLDFLEKTSIIDVKLGDHVSAEMAVMFSDVRSFTTLSEGMTPQQNFDFVNSYLKRVSPTIQQHNGFIVKYLGDGMMAVFPYEVEDALKAGIEKLKVVALYNQERAENNEGRIDLGIGIHTGHMMVGMVGEEGRMQGDAFSDNVNLTSRIEGLTKHFGTNLIISAETLSRLEEPGKYHLRPLGKVQVKGREKPITLFEVFDADPDDLRELKLATRIDYEHALKVYAAGHFSDALTLFEKVVQQNPADKTSAYYIERCVYYLAHGTPEMWDGVEVMTSK